MNTITVSEQPLPRTRIYFTALVLLVQLAHLTWEHFNGGVQSHHILNSSDLPAISNWWGALLLPVLTWFLTGTIQKRVALHASAQGRTLGLPARIVVGFIGSLLFGVLLSGAFTNGYETITMYLFMGMFALAIFLPVYHAEYVLGFILGMTFTFGAVIPMAVSAILAALSAVMHLFVYPIFMRLWAWFKHL